MRKQAKLLANFLSATKELTTEYTGLAEITDNELNQIGFTVMKRQDRKTAAKALAAKGHSTREIAAFTGWDQKTISNDLREENSSKSEENSSPRKSKPNGKHEPNIAERTNALMEVVSDALEEFQPRYEEWLSSNPPPEAREAMWGILTSGEELISACRAELFPERKRSK